MDGFHHHIGMVKTTSLQMENVCCEPSLRGSNFVIRRYVAACFFKGKPHRLRLSWIIGVDAILSRFVVEWPSLVEKRFYYLAETWFHHAKPRVVSTEEIFAEARKSVACTVHHVDCESEWKLPQRYSSWTRLVRVTAYVLKFIKNSKREKNSLRGRKLLIEVSELREAAHHWFRLV